MKDRRIKILALLLGLVMVLGVLPGIAAYAAEPKVISKDVEYYIGDTIQFSSPYPWVLYDDSWSDYKAQLKARDNTTVPEPTYDNDPRCLQWKFSNVWTYENDGWTSYTLRITGPADRKPIGFKCVGGTGTKNDPFTFACIYLPTVTYQPGVGATGEEKSFDAVKDEQGNYTHSIQKYEDNFTAPEGKHFDHWDDGKGHTYKYGDTIDPVTENITLTAIWVDDSKPDSGSGGGSGADADIVFNIPGEDNSWEYGGGYAPQYAYRVSLAPMQGGSAALGLMTGDSGTALNVYPTTTVFVFPNANPGYVLDKIVWSLIDGSASYDITEAKNFVMPAMDVVVYVTFRPVG